MERTLTQGVRGQYAGELTKERWAGVICSVNHKRGSNESAKVNRVCPTTFLIAMWISGCTTVLQHPHEDQDAVSRWMIEQERAWANMACGGKWISNDVFADDFKGTGPNGGKYGKPTGQPTYNPNTKWHTDCRLDQAEVRFYGASAAVVFGAESKTVPLPDGKQERRCLVWTDTWLRRNSKWQMIAAQDSRITCPTVTNPNLP
jgi:hypothetical protein